jgi:hypothetical protein
MEEFKTHISHGAHRKMTLFPCTSERIYVQRSF